MKILAIICRVLLGLIFVVFGANHLVTFIHGPMPAPDSLAGHFFAVMVPSGWMKVVGIFEIIGGLLVLFGGTAPLGLAILAPVIVNILLYGLLLTGGQGMAIPGFVTLLEILLLYFYRSSFYGLLSTKAQPV